MSNAVNGSACVPAAPVMTAPLLALLLLAGAPSWGAMTDCRPAGNLELMVRFADDPPRRASLRSSGTGLVLEDSRSGARLWSAGPDAAALQRFGDMTAGFGESLVAIHLDQDGLHDRLYAGDRAGRLWRFELLAGARPEHWARGGVWADLGLAGGARGFIAAADVALVNTPEGNPWLNVALGSATTGEAPVENRFYFLRDTLEGELPVQPLTEAQLLTLSLSPMTSGITRASTDPESGHMSDVRGYFLPLGNAQVLAPALTLAGQTHFTVVETAQPLVAQCADNFVPTRRVALSVTILRMGDGTADASSNGDGSSNGQIDQRNVRRSLPSALPADARVDLAPAVTGDSGRRSCEIADEPLPDCALDTMPRAAGWRREDVD